MSPRFDAEVRPGGYAWWYLDAWSDDGTQGLALIGFVGSVFSPYYAWSRRRGGGTADPLAHCALNLALYGAPGARVPRAWSMTERGARHVRRSAHTLEIGPSRLAWDGTELVIDIDERAVPWPARLRGQVRVRADQWLDRRYPLDEAGRHGWRPIAPHARVEVAFEDPGMRWRGTGYLDANEGERPAADDFSRWDWCRAPLAGGASTVHYDVDRRQGPAHRLALVFAPGAAPRHVAPLPRHALARTGWGLARHAAGEAGARPEVIQTLEDGPFYARSRLRAQLAGETVEALHESLSLDRWRQPLVQAMLPFRMPRRG